MPASDHWRVGLGDPELLEQLIHLRIGLQVQPGEPDPVPCQEIADPERVVRVTRADHTQTGEASRFAQKLLPRDERLEDEVAQVWAPVQDFAEGIGRHRVNFTIGQGDGSDDRRTARELPSFAGEFAGLVNDDDLRRIPGLIADLDLTRLDDEELGVAIAASKERLPGPILRQRRTAQLPRVATCASSSVGNATACKSCSAMSPPPVGIPCPRQGCK